ncbi:putative orphan protein [Pseudoalteromonas translucida]|uniref:Orphan protein n=1 Tax=Pseudoalteromonas translucida (strain TAC 125) TaxID=326442 RepID=Q3IKE6_PSET1|nr:putative orphan protein [Pseudoalteromonas translucida]
MAHSKLVISISEADISFMLDVI